MNQLPLIIIGAGGHAKGLIDILHRQQRQIIGCTGINKGLNILIRAIGVLRQRDTRVRSRYRAHRDLYARQDIRKGIRCRLLLHAIDRDLCVLRGPGHAEAHVSRGCAIAVFPPRHGKSRALTRFVGAQHQLLFARGITQQGRRDTRSAIIDFFGQRLQRVLSGVLDINRFTALSQLEIALGAHLLIDRASGRYRCLSLRKLRHTNIKSAFACNAGDAD